MPSKSDASLRRNIGNRRVGCQCGCGSEQGDGGASAEKRTFHSKTSFVGDGGSARATKIVDRHITIPRCTGSMTQQRQNNENFDNELRLIYRHDVGAERIANAHNSPLFRRAADLRLSTTFGATRNSSIARHSTSGRLTRTKERWTYGSAGVLFMSSRLNPMRPAASPERLPRPA